MSLPALSLNVPDRVASACSSALSQPAWGSDATSRGRRPSGSQSGRERRREPSARANATEVGERTPFLPAGRAVRSRSKPKALTARAANAASLGSALARGTAASASPTDEDEQAVTVARASATSTASWRFTTARRYSATNGCMRRPKNRLSPYPWGVTVSPDLALATRDLRKSYGSRVALAGLDLSVPSGVVYGFLGPNGAGKTTTMRLLTGLIHPDAGTIEVLGRPFGRRDRRRLFEVGALDRVADASTRTCPAGENLRELAATGAPVPKGRVEELLELVGLRDRASDKVVRRTRWA